MNRKHNHYLTVRAAVREEYNTSPHHTQSMNKRKYRPSNRTPKIVVYTRDLYKEQMTARARHKVLTDFRSLKEFGAALLEAHHR
jgi:hypothetical protein